MKARFRYILLCLVMIVCFVLCSCARVVTNYSDELTLHTWQAQLDNGNSVSLSFQKDDATLSLAYPDKTKVSICGFCEVSDTTFVIHDNATFTAYAFDYTVHFDSVDITYDDITLSLNKIS